MHWRARSWISNDLFNFAERRQSINDWGKHCPHWTGRSALLLCYFLSCHSIRVLLAKDKSSKQGSIPNIRLLAGNNPTHHYEERLQSGRDCGKQIYVRFVSVCTSL